jgi:hypothetical protein
VNNVDIVIIMCAVIKHIIFVSLHLFLCVCVLFHLFHQRKKAEWGAERKLMKWNERQIMQLPWQTHIKGYSKGLCVCVCVCPVRLRLKALWRWWSAHTLGWSEKGCWKGIPVSCVYMKKLLLRLDRLRYIVLKLCSLRSAVATSSSCGGGRNIHINYGFKCCSSNIVCVFMCDCVCASL